MTIRQKLHYYRKAYNKMSGIPKILLLLGCFGFGREKEEIIYFKFRLWNPFSWIIMIVVAIANIVYYAPSFIMGIIKEANENYVYKDREDGNNPLR